MSLNDIQLPASVVAALYASSLIHDDKEEIPKPENNAPAEERPEAPGWHFLGNNEKQILVLVNHTDSLYLPDDELTFLTKMLTACKLGIGDVAIVNLHQHKHATAKEFQAEFKSRTALLFGVDPVEFGLPVSFPAFQVQNVVKTQYLYAPPLADVNKDELLKSKLWVSLKRIFSL